nr:helix-turn-helix transcriptional regulator [Streptomyces sp. ODS25]
MKTLRLRAGLDREQFGKRIGYAPSTVAAFEQGRRVSPNAVTTPLPAWPSGRRAAPSSFSQPSPTCTAVTSSSSGTASGPLPISVPACSAIVHRLPWPSAPAGTL